MGQGSGPASAVSLIAAPAADVSRFSSAIERTGLSVRRREGPTWPIEEAVGCVVVVRTELDDAIATIEAVRDRRPELPIVYVAGEDGRAVSEAIAAGATQFVPRTLSDAPALLVERLEAALDTAPSERPAADGGAPVSTLADDEERRLKERAMDEAPVGITIADATRPDTPLIYANAAFERVTGYPPEETLERNCRFLQGEETDPGAIQALRDGIESEQPVTVELRNYRQDGSPFWNEVTIAPVRDRDGDVTHFVGFQNDVTDRKEAEQALERERRNLDHLLERVNGLLSSVHGDLVEATTREAIETAIAGRIADEAIYAWCWVARPDPARNALEVTASAGALDSAPDNLDLSLTGEAVDRDSLSALISRAFDTEAVEVLDDPAALESIAAEIPGSPDELAGIAAIPLVYRETCYGVVTIATTESDALEARELVVLEAIARASATAINAIERGRLLSTDAVTEIEFELRDGDLFVVDLSETLDAEVVYEGGVFEDDGGGRLFYTVDADPDAIRAALETLERDATIVTAFEDGALLSVSVGTDSIVGRLAERGGTIRSMGASEGACRLTVEIPATADARAVVTALEERYPTIELRSFRELDRPPATRQAFVDELRGQLTDRQQTAITTAYVSGFYEWNRSVSGEELAESMGITRSTFHQHRRAAERKLIGAVVDG